jgi:tetratricopeptide (TPR) repeat protein
MNTKQPPLTRLVIGIALVVVALTALDRFLARVEAVETHSTAQNAYVAGERLLAEGKTSDAIDSLLNAHSQERENPRYELALVQALTQAGKTAQADPLMQEMLDRDPNDGEVNLTAAHLATREGKSTEAEAYDHRAIYGEWPKDAAAHRIAVRMELINRLMAEGRKQEAVAELIPLEAEPRETTEMRVRIAQLFLQADSPARAADVARGIIAKDPKDAAAYEGLGQAELEEGQYSAARSAFVQASYDQPGNASVESHLRMLNMVVALDPTIRQLTSEEKYRRSILLLERAQRELAACAPASPLLSSADTMLHGKLPAHVNNEDAETVLALAQSIWRAWDNGCGARPGSDEVVNLLMKKLAS